MTIFHQTSSTHIPSTEYLSSQLEERLSRPEVDQRENTPAWRDKKNFPTTSPKNPITPPPQISIPACLSPLVSRLALPPCRTADINTLLYRRRARGGRAKLRRGKMCSSPGGCPNFPNRVCVSPAPVNCIE